MRRLGIFGLFFLSVFLACCAQDYSPKPRGYFSIKLPEKKYQLYSSDCPYTFDYPVYAQVLPDKERGAKPCWLDISYPDFNGRIHLSYQKITSRKELERLSDDAYKLAFKHTVKATSIDNATISYPDKRVFGTYYTIDGNTASSVQFFLTDSTDHYLRGALYFNEQPRLDSIQPVLDFIKKDIDVMIKSLKWKR